MRKCIMLQPRDTNGQKGRYTVLKWLLKGFPSALDKEYLETIWICAFEKLLSLQELSLFSWPFFVTFKF